MMDRLFFEAVDIYKLIVSQIVAGEVVEKYDIENIVDRLYPEVRKQTRVLHTLHEIRHKDDYQFEHSVGVCVISLKIGQIMGMEDDSVRNLGMAGLLHDVGKARLPEGILDKPGTLSVDEFEEIKKHPVYGYRIVKELAFDDKNIEYGVLQHHERLDGNGYPIQVPADKINRFARIIAVADVFDAITSDRAYRQGSNLIVAVEEICQRDSGYLDPLITRRLIQYILNVSPGDRVILNDGREATIMMMYDDEPMRPLVKTGDEFIDLKEVRTVKIIDIP